MLLKSGIKSNQTLIFSAIESNEFDLLLLDLVPVLSRADLIVELHDDHGPAATETLGWQCVSSHPIEVAYHGAKYPPECPIPKAIPTKNTRGYCRKGAP
jgi:hypothetical protein